MKNKSNKETETDLEIIILKNILSIVKFTTAIGVVSAIGIVSVIVYAIVAR